MFACLKVLNCNSLAFRISVLLRLLLDLDAHCGVDHLGVFHPFLKKVADIISTKLSLIFRRLTRLGLFLECWQYANVTAIPTSAPSPENYRSISITHILSKVYEKLVSHKLSSFSEKCVFLPAGQFVHRKSLGCTDALRTISHHLQMSLDAKMESYILQLHFSAGFDRVSLNGLLYKLKSIGVGGNVLSICKKFLSDLRQRVVVDGAASECIPVVSGVTQEVCWVPFCLSNIPAKCMNWSRTDYMPMHKTPHYTASCSQASRKTWGRMHKSSCGHLSKRRSNSPRRVPN